MRFVFVFESLILDEIEFNNYISFQTILDKSTKHKINHI